MLQIVEPGNVQRNTRLLPGSREREELRVSSLDELKKEMDEVNKKNKRKSFIIKTIVLSTIAAVVLHLAFNTKSSEDTKKAFRVLMKIFKYLGYGAAAVSFVRGFKDSSASKFEIVNPGEVKKPNIEKSIEKVKIQPENIPDKEGNIKSLAVKATLDTLIESGLVSEREIKNRAKAYNFRKPDNVDKSVVKDMVRYGKKL